MPMLKWPECNQQLDIEWLTTDELKTLQLEIARELVKRKKTLTKPVVQLTDEQKNAHRMARYYKQKFVEVGYGGCIIHYKKNYGVGLIEAKHYIDSLGLS